MISLTCDSFLFHQALCEKGLAAMEASHKRIIHELEEKHQQEIAKLILEKEQALAEETQVGRRSCSNHPRRLTYEYESVCLSLPGHIGSTRRHEEGSPE